MLFRDRMVQSRFLQLTSFVVVGGVGTLINLGSTLLLVEFFLGVDRYFLANMIGLLANIIFNFVLYTLAVFKARHNHVRRLAIFVTYSILIAILYAATIKVVTPIVGIKYYLGVSISAIAFFAVVNFLVFKLSIFKEPSDVTNLK